MPPKPRRAAKKRGGRPTKRTELVVEKLERAFRDDFTDEEACRSAGIDKQTLYNWYKADPAFLDRMRRAQDYPLILAKKRLLRGFQGLDGGSLALKFLERRQRERYSPKLTLEHEGGVAVTYSELEGQPRAKSVEQAREMAARLDASGE